MKPNEVLRLLIDARKDYVAMAFQVAAVQSKRGAHSGQPNRLPIVLRLDAGIRDLSLVCGVQPPEWAQEMPCAPNPPVKP
jgi:hypothetical protein